jgi:hypothetical protein
MNGLWTLNGGDLYATYGCMLLKGAYKDILSAPAVKKRAEYNYLDKNGLDVDTSSALKFEAKRFKIPIAFVANSTEDFWNNYNALLAEISVPDEFSLYVQELGVTLNLLFEGMEYKIHRFQSNGAMASYDLAVLEADPTNREYDKEEEANEE